MWHKLAVRFCTEELFNSRGIEPLELSTNKAVQYYPKNYFLIASLREFTVRHFWTTSPSPRQFLPKEQRNLPRLDRRKEQLKQHIQQALKESRNFQEFEQKIKEKGFRIIKGRGISFIDDKKVKVKGSELNYSLQTIERILEKQRMTHLTQPSGLQAVSKKTAGGQESNPDPKMKPISEALSEKLRAGLTAMVEQVLKPEETKEQSSNELLQQPKRKKKIRRSHRW